jgi:glyoxylase-like metal-dependent hydrolase (beta-lactamase superfamily II)
MNMNSGAYHFKLGDFNCVCLSDGSLDYPLKNFFTNVPVEEVERALREQNLPTDYITTPYTHLYINTGDHRMLVDMGAGHLGPRTGRLLPNMLAAGIHPLQIDTVVITHAHPDHIGGALDCNGRLNFLNAVYYISRVEWDFWFSEDARKKTPEVFVTIARQNLEPIRSQVQLVENEGEILPGIRVYPAPGHTPGHMVVEAVSANDCLFYIADTVLYPLHLQHPGWLPVDDILPEEAAASKQAIFDRIAEQKALVVGQHFPPFPSLGYVIKETSGWRWKPLSL